MVPPKRAVPRHVRKGEGFAMAEHLIPHFHNDPGVPVIEIGAKEFMCVGAKPPHDHPHVFIDMGDESEAVCPYCSTLYRYRADLKPEQTDPPGHIYRDLAAA
jgi:uncharacterized Zn-finger protein